MQLPVQVIFRNLESSDAIATRVQQSAAKLDKFYNRIIGCKVTVEAPHWHHHKGNLYSVRIDLTLPKGELIINRNPDKDHAHEDMYVAIRDAFDAAERKLKDYAETRRQEVKVHETPPHGRIITLLADDGYGFIETADGREIYFHQNSVLNGDFRNLQIGSAVQFVEEMGEKGPQATSVRIA